MGAIIPIRGRARKKLRADAVELYKQNWSTRQIGMKFGYAHSTIQNILREAGVELRPRGGARIRRKDWADITKTARKSATSKGGTAE